ncbi:exopolysaccharide biosynthesis protein, WecB/TagA/CpsF family [Thermobacillus composti KWC4]|uniref:N-acetylglucosaminyldiphosphoundecaprenol N-acetyl-beta-D-mannosaminyltransferase n=1 Tax=Thermobacillus composti (strain DSM 18247 / JCM 13945 / KWC4) TaxID=717605 RepID=L0EJL5_THECK|nr:WecB/TagA/CpsF family glycosyltransferase [Thermobacillus composti]AGA59839.1 exopolysaccharide biosynthesis protein, WecB/TagA/CpsF family [Thermobacillus composti KWC4]
MSQKPDYPAVPIFGLPFSKMNMAETVAYLARAVEARRPTQVITGNPIMVMAALERPDYYRVMEQAELIVPDGAGIVWASRFAGNPVPERVAGFDLLHELMREGERRRWSAYLLGARQEVVEEVARRLQERYPLVRIAGWRNGYFGPEDDAGVVAAIREAAPDLLFVARDALTTQEPWIARYKHELGVPVMMGVGGSFDVIAGRTKRAPVFFQKLGLEWLYRLLRQPSRAGRMAALPRFVLKVLRAGRKLGERPDSVRETEIKKN